jgi:hypothetical protein
MPEFVSTFAPFSIPAGTSAGQELTR